jgi:DNA-binding XRE family transcriptional regulator
LELILDVNDVTITEYRTEDNDAGHWDLRRHQPNGLFLDAALYDSGRRLGVEPVLLRVGANRVQLKAHLLRHIKDQTLEGRMTLGERLVLLRRLAGLSRGALAQAVGVTHETIGNLETGEVREFHNRRNWQRLSIAMVSRSSTNCFLSKKSDSADSGRGLLSPPIRSFWIIFGGGEKTGSPFRTSRHSIRLNGYC